jgi:hypothetical protein
MENQRLRQDMQIVCDSKKCQKLIGSTRLKSFKIINENTVLVNRVKKSVLLDKPMYAGFCILELSKLIMYNFHYNVIVKRYGDSARLLFTDTDSLTYSVQCDDFYADMLIEKDWYDTSNYDPSSPLFSKVNEKVIGKFKDETAGQSPSQFVGLRSKMYSLLIEKGKPSKQTAKGVKRGYVEKHVRHEMYLKTLRTRIGTRANFMNFRSLLHNVQTVNFSRVCLSAYDDKRWVCEDGIHTLAYGHVKLTTL